MLILTQALALLATATSLTAALPQASNPVTADTVYYQGQLSFSGPFASSEPSCGTTQVSTGTITGGVCTELYTYGLGIYQKSDEVCTFKLWTGSSTCGDGAPSTVFADIPQGDELSCFNTGDLDGGVHYPASGIYEC